MSGGSARVRAICFALVVGACGTSEPSPSAQRDEPASEARETPPPTPSPTPEATEPASEDRTDAPAAEPRDLLHRVPAAVAVSSAYRDSAAQVARLVDEDFETAWNSRTGDLDGAWIDVRLPENARVTAIQMTVGFTHVTDRADLFTGNHRVRRVRVTHGGETVGETTLDPDRRGLQTIPVEGGGGDYRIELVELVPGTRDDWREACVSELRVLGHAPIAHAVYTPRSAIGTLPELGPMLEGEALDDALDERIDALDRELTGLYIHQANAPALVMDASGCTMHVDGAQRFARDPDGLVWTCAQEDGHGYRLHTPDGTVSLPEGAYCGPFAVGPRGRSWVLSHRGLHAFDGSTWTMAPRHGVRGANALAADAEGTLYVVGPTSVARLRGETFEPVEIRGEVDRMRHAVAAGQHLAVLHSGGLLRLEGDTLTPVTVASPRGPMRGFRSIALSTDGRLVAVHEYWQTIVVSQPGVPVQQIGFEDIEGQPLGVSAVAFDGRDRLWMFADSGLTIVGPDDLTQVVRRYAPGTLPDLIDKALGGEIEWVRGLYVESDGPPLPANISLPSGRVHGRLVRDGQPLANQQLLFCTNPMRGNLGSGFSDPCARSGEEEYELARYVRTRADGTFDFWGAPEQAVLVTRTGDRDGWFFSTSDRCCAQLQEGRTLDLGDVEVP